MKTFRKWSDIIFHMVFSPLLWNEPVYQKQPNLIIVSETYLLSCKYIPTLGDVKNLVSRYIEGYSLAETANRAESDQLQFWSEPSVLNLRSSNTPETVAFNIPWYLENLKNVTHPNLHGTLSLKIKWDFKNIFDVETRFR